MGDVTTFRDWRFGKGVPQICFGKDLPCSLLVGLSTGYLDAMRFQCITGGTVEKIRVYTGNSGSGTLRMGVYTDSLATGRPGGLLKEGTNQSYVPNVWVEETITGLTVTSGTWYWLAFKVSVNGVKMCLGYDGSPNAHTYISGQAYALPFPNPWGNSASARNSHQWTIQLCVAGGVTDVYSGRGIGRGISRGVMR